MKRELRQLIRYQRSSFSGLAVFVVGEQSFSLSHYRNTATAMSVVVAMMNLT
jgi:hypothetical protein